LFDLDAVLITTPGWKAAPLAGDGYSIFNARAVKHLNELLQGIYAELWESSLFQALDIRQGEA